MVSVIGTLSLMSFSLYRVVHQTHHAYLATERDYEFWPLSQPTVPRWKRCLAAFCELNFGLFFTHSFFCAHFLFRPHQSAANGFADGFGRNWRSGRDVDVSSSGASQPSACGNISSGCISRPALLAANLQSWRKYIEHVGLTGDTVNGSTRSIVAKSWLGRLMAFSLLHEPFHGVHHQRAGLPHSVLPQYVEKLQPKAARRTDTLIQVIGMLCSNLIALLGQSARRPAMANG